MTLPARTSLMVGLREPIEPLLTADEWAKVALIPDPSGTPSFTIYERR